MQVFGFTIARTRTDRTKAAPNTALVTDISAFNRGWTRILESFSGAWQQNVEVTTENVLTYSAVYACVSLIAADVGKLRLKLIAETSPGIWEETKNAAYSPVLRKPNHYQTRIQFLEQWIVSKLLAGNTYVLKERDQRGVVIGLYVLDPRRVRALVAPDGAVYYDLQADLLSGMTTGAIVPSREIIHDVMVPLYHPLCGVSPITACGLAAAQGLAVQKQSTKFFGNAARPSGILSTTMPGVLDPEEVKRIEQNWESHFAGDNAGKIAVLGSDLKYQPMAMTAVDAQLIEQLKWTAENVCTAFKVPGYMIGVGPEPNGQTVEARTQQYYSQCLQTLIENVEVLLDEGIELSDVLGTELDLDGLMRMDTAARVKAAAEAINGGGMTANESRRRFHGLAPVEGGNAVLSQQQNFSLAALAKRDARDDPFTKATDTTPAPPPPPAAQAARAFTKTLDLLRAA